MSGLSGRGILLIVVSLVVATTVVAAFVLMGPPDRTRLYRIDERRVETLQAIAGALESHYENQKELPGRLEDVRAGVLAARGWSDPVTGQPFEYRVIGGSRYELCATFDLASDAPQAANPLWWHGAGRQCFELNAENPYPFPPARRVVPVPDTTSSGP